jgi:hypothetical protein
MQQTFRYTINEDGQIESPNEITFLTYPSLMRQLLITVE